MRRAVRRELDQLLEDYEVNEDDRNLRNSSRWSVVRTLWLWHMENPRVGRHLLDRHDLELPADVAEEEVIADSVASVDGAAIDSERAPPDPADPSTSVDALVAAAAAPPLALTG